MIQNPAKTILLIVAGIAAISGPILFGSSRAPQAAGPLVFQTATITTDTTGPSMSLYCHGADSRPTRAAPPGKCVFTFAPVIRIIAFAYDIPFGADIDQVISGGPAWLDTERYDIDAKAGQPSTEAEMKQMLQALLAERFKLSFHRVPQDVSAYALVVAKTGPKLGETRKDKTPFMSLGGDGRIVAQNQTMAQLAVALKTVLNRSVVDQTHLTKAYDFTLTWSPEGDQFGGLAFTRNLTAPFILTAIQEQLGLALESKKGQGDILVINHVERPSPN